jgi:DNA-binding Xre family transcriptional regulator
MIVHMFTEKDKERSKHNKSVLAKICEVLNCELEEIMKLIKK